MADRPRLKLHARYGVNPTREACYWCDRETGRVVHLGHNGGRKAPERVATSHAMCDDCLERARLGVVVAEVVDRPQAGPGAAIRDEDGVDWYPTGAWVRVAPDAASRYFTREQCDSATLHGYLWMPAGLYRELFGADEGETDPGAPRGPARGG